MRFTGGLRCDVAVLVSAAVRAASAYRLTKMSRR
jgi:hypothetical protein